MSEKTYTADDPRVTAYALGELDEAELAEFESQLAASPELQAAVEDVRDFSEQLAAELKTEATPALTGSQRSALETASVTTALEPAPPRRRYLAVVIAGVTVLSLALLALFLPPGEEASMMLAQRESLHLPNAATAVAPEDGADWFERGDAMATHHSSARELAQMEESFDGVADDSRNANLSFDAQKLSESEVRFREGGRFNAGNGIFPARPADSPDASERPTASPELEGKPFFGQPGQFGGKAPANSTTAPAGPPAAQEPTSGSKQVKVLITDGQNGSRTLKAGAHSTRVNESVGDRSSSGPVSRRFGDRKELSQQAQQQQGLGNKPNANVGGFADDDISGEAYNPIVENEFQSPTKDPLSTFSIDVDTASYANVRRFLNHGQWPPAAAVRIEELVNYFRYDYPEPEGEHPFSVALEAAACPWNPDHRLVRIGLQGKDFDREQRPPSSLVFLIDVSGSMRPNNKLPLVKDSLTKLVDQMTEDDHIAIVTYAGNAGLVLDSTSGEHKDRILAAINGLGAGGSTNGAGGIQLAYETAIRHFYDKGTNRVILCTDGDFNVGISSDNELVSMITDKAKTGVFLSVFGFGMGNLKDAKLEQLADKGNGQYGYIDDQREAYKVFGEELTGTLYTIAKDVKIQVEFNPARVGAYRLIGYENRALAARDFNDDTKDAGEIGAGHRVTALYEIIPPEKLGERPAGVDPLKYQKPAKPQADDTKAGKELLTVKLRYKQPDEVQSTKLEVPLVDPANPKAMPSQEFEFAAAVAAFGMILRDSQFRGQADLDLVLELARGNVGDDNNGHRQEFLELVKRAKELQPNR